MKLLQNAASRKAALEGTVIAIDPSSGGEDSKTGEASVAGFAIMKAARIQESGTLHFPVEKVVAKRLRNVFSVLKEKWPDDSWDLLVLEDIRGYKAQQSLIQSCGVYIVGLDSKEFFQPNVSTWKAIARAWGGYVKSDETDAVYMLYATVAIALGWKSSLKAAAKEEVIAKAKELVLG